MIDLTGEMMFIDYDPKKTSQCYRNFKALKKLYRTVPVLKEAQDP